MSRQKIILFMLVSILNWQPAQAQSWGQIKSAAQEAESAKNLIGAQSYWEKALELCQDKSGPRYLQSLSGMAHCLYLQGKFEAAEEYYKKALSFAKPGRAAEGDLKETLIAYAEMLRTLKREPEAKALEDGFNLLATDSLAKDAAPPSSSNPASPSSSSEIDRWKKLIDDGSNEMSLKHFDQAETYFKDSLALSDKLSKPRMQSQSLNKLIMLYYAQDKVQLAEPFYARCLALVKKTSGADSKEYADSLRGHAEILRKLNRKKEALAEESEADLILTKQQLRMGAGSAGSSPANVDTSATRRGSIYDRARAAQQGFNNGINQLLEE